MRSLASASVQFVAWLALIRCLGVFAAVARQGLRLDRTVVTKWGWAETLAAPEPFLMVAFAGMLLKAGNADRSLPASAALAMVGVVLAALGMSVWIWAFATIPSLSSGHYLLPEQQLVTRGPYARVRHPIYLAVILLWLAVATASASLVVLAITLLYVGPVYLLYSRSEERMMLAHFGAPYQQYQRSTGMLVPRIRETPKRVREVLQDAIRQSTTQGTRALLAKSLLNAVLFFAVFMVALPWLSHRFLPRSVFLPAVLRTWLAGGCFVVGIGIWGACLDSFSRHGRGTPLPLDAPRELVTRGPFSVVRNPIMAGEVLVIWGEALYLASLGVLLYAVIIGLGAQAAVRWVEEPELRKRFGASYDEYCRQVPRWVPRIGRRA